MAQDFAFGIEEEYFLADEVTGRSPEESSLIVFTSSLCEDSIRIGQVDRSGCGLIRSTFDQRKSRADGSNAPLSELLVLNPIVSGKKETGSIIKFPEAVGTKY